MKRMHPVAGKRNQLRYEMERSKWQILGIAKLRLNASETLTDEGHKLWHNAEERYHENGVGFLVHNDTKYSVFECEPISIRMIRI